MTHQQHRRPLWLGFAVAPLAAPLLFVVFLACLPNSHIDLGDAAFLLAVALPISYVGMLAGLPVVYWLKAVGWLNAVAVCLGATIAGINAMLIGAFFLSSSLHGLPQQMASGAVLGAISGIAFCLVTGITIHSSRNPIATRLDSA